VGFPHFFGSLLALLSAAVTKLPSYNTIGYCCGVPFGFRPQGKPIPRNTSDFQKTRILRSNLMLTEKIRKDILKKSKGSYMGKGIIYKTIVTDNGD
jgi:hypothetical protein